MREGPEGRRRGATFTVVLLACLSLVFVACGDDGETASDGGQAAGGSQSDAAGAKGGGKTSGNAVRFGALLGITGDYGPFNGPALEAQEIAIDEVNAEGGIKGRPLEQIVADTKSSVEGAVAGFSKLVEVDKVVALTTLDSDGATATYDAIHEAQVPTMCAACGTAFLDDKGGKFIWRPYPSDTDLGPATAQIAREEGYGKISMLVQQTEGSLSLAEEVKEAYVAEGGEVCADVRFDGGKSSYATDVRNAFACDPDALYIYAGEGAGIPILQEWARRGYGKELFFTTDLSGNKVAEMFPQLEGGVAASVFPSFDNTLPAYDSFAKRYTDKTGRVPSETFVETYRYDEIIIFALAASAADEITGPAIAAEVNDVMSAPGKKVNSYAEGVAALKAGDEIDYQGASGPLEVDEFGNLASPTFRKLIIEDGKWKPDELFALEG